MSQSIPPLVDAAWLERHLDDPKIVILDASWWMPAQKRNADAEFLDARIAGARRFDFDQRIADRSSPLPHMLPSPDQFETEVRLLGIDNDSKVVCYDAAGIFAAPRAWWMFKAMGHADVSVLDGGLPAWRASGGRIESGALSPIAAGHFTARPDASRLRNANDVLAVLQQKSAQVVDARSAPRFQGTEMEPRPGLRSGGMPGAFNVPFDRLLVGGRMRPAGELRQAFLAAGVNSAKPLVTTCGSGVTASVLALAMEVAGIGKAAVYDGSWAEWGQESRPDLPVARAGDVA
jgi:thiosulfate/3-mercaptopyruvate sulfurtransferase